MAEFWAQVVVDIGARNMEVQQSMDFIEFVGRVVAALEDGPSADPGGGIDLAYVERVIAERDRTMATLLEKVLGGPGKIVETPGHTVCTAAHNALQLTWDPPGEPSKRRPCTNGPDRCVAVGMSRGIMGACALPASVYVIAHPNPRHPNAPAARVFEPNTVVGLCQRRDASQDAGDVSALP